MSLFLPTSVDMWHIQCSMATDTFACFKKRLCGLPFTTHFSQVEKTKIAVDTGGRKGYKSILFTPPFFLLLPQNHQGRQVQHMSSSLVLITGVQEADYSISHHPENTVWTLQRVGQSSLPYLLLYLISPSIPITPSPSFSFFFSFLFPLPSPSPSPFSDSAKD